MKQTLLISGLCALLTLTAVPAAAECYADYKAKRDDPLQLHYGVIDLTDDICASPGAAEAEIGERIGADGWTLLSVVSVFGEEGLAERRANAGEFYLRY